MTYFQSRIPSVLPSVCQSRKGSSDPNEAGIFDFNLLTAHLAKVSVEQTDIQQPIINKYQIQNISQCDNTSNEFQSLTAEITFISNLKLQQKQLKKLKAKIKNLEQASLNLMENLIILKDNQKKIKGYVKR